MSQAKAISRKHLSIIDIFSMFSTKQSQIDFFFKFKWPHGFICPYCGNVHYTYCEVRELYECTSCHKQTTLKAGTIMQDSKLSLFQWILMLYFICDSTNGISALELSRRVGIGYTSARLNSRKIKYSMMLRNDKYQFTDTMIEHDEILIGAPTRNGKRGMGSDKQKAFIDVGLENNIYPTFIKITLVDNCKNEKIKERLLEITDGNTVVTIKTDGKVGLGKAIEPQFKSDVGVNDHEHLHWLNTITSNLKTFILGTYHGIAKRYLCFAIAEFEWRFNRRKNAKHKLEAGLRAITSCHFMTGKMLVQFFQG